MAKQLKPPFTLATATEKVQRAEDLWNSKDPATVALAYTEDTQWRNRGEFVQGRKAVEQLLQTKWQQEQQYSLKKELFSFSDNRIAVQFEYEYHDEDGQWHRAFGNEHWTFDQQGLMHTRNASINEVAITAADRRTL